MTKVLITTVPFGEASARPLDLLSAAGLEFKINPLGRRLQADEVADMICDVDAVIAGTEPITADALRQAQNLKLIARVGIGLDSVDLLAARDLGMAVSYTPDGPSPAVSELTIGLMIDLLRNTSATYSAMRDAHWQRHMGRRLADSTVGIIGVGRIGKGVIRHLYGGFPGVKILANDIVPDHAFGDSHGVTWVDKETIYRESDILSLHVPLTPETDALIGQAEIALLGPEAFVINTARGGIVSERDLANALRSGKLAGAAIDVFLNEPYVGELAQIDSCITTCHMGSMTQDCRARMEIESTEEVVRFFSGEPLRTPVPENEYSLAKASLSFNSKKE